MGSSEGWDNMFNIFQQYWTLLVAAVIAFIVVLQVRSIFPEKRRWWQWLIPVGLAVAAFGFDFLVKTDLEKVNAVIKAGMAVVEQENIAGIDALISPNYTDSRHATKAHLMRYCRTMLTEPLVEKNKKFGSTIELSPPQATAVLTVLITFEKDSFVSKTYKPTLLVKTQLQLQKQPDKNWLINSAELLAIDRQPVSWRQIR
jgi:hypothetical protein